ncbi:LysR family transcriptional regulator [Terasakiella sp. A23]|uniref:LysR family transcriptional regulator n=1 Tax=Terasakiella sp. FCG-A23 TaxID=3080561 RepID=UPI002954D866|nr:LysR family transcriptional regulator [Terasakiella sp. A23]MDV7338537.1 LysR family transcriptional regulator [Terasakiella sp. A23]
MPSIAKPFDWDDLKYFLAVARVGTLRGGAESINANHATLSRRLNMLEENMGARLFDRTQSGLVLTQTGEELLPHAQRVEEEINAASRTVIGRDLDPKGPIYFSMPPFMAMSFLAEELADFSSLYKDIDLHIEVTNTIVDLARREADVSLRVVSEVHDDVVGRKLSGYSKAAYCSPDYAEQMQDNGGEGLHWIGWMEPEGDTTAPWIKESAYPKAKLRHRIHEGVPQITLATAGVGLTQIPCFMGDRVSGLVRAPFQKPVVDQRNIWLLLHRDLRKTARVRLFVDFLAERIHKRKHELLVEF